MTYMCLVILSVSMIGDDYGVGYALWFESEEDDSELYEAEGYDAEHRKNKAYWNGKLKALDLGVLQDRIVRLRLPLSSGRFVLVVPKHWDKGRSNRPEPRRYRPGYPYILDTSWTTRRCYHPSLHSLDSILGTPCPDCNQRLPAESVGHVGMARAFAEIIANSAARPKSAYKAPPDEESTWAYSDVDRADTFIDVGWEQPTVPPKEKKQALHISPLTAPEIEHRRLRYLSDPQRFGAEIRRRLRRHKAEVGSRPTANAIPRYHTAPVEKVWALHKKGWTQQRIARWLDVSERTVRSRMDEYPQPVPQEMSAAALLSSRVLAGGGYSKKMFWPSSTGNATYSCSVDPDVCTVPAPGYYKKGPYGQRRLSGS